MDGETVFTDPLIQPDDDYIMSTNSNIAGESEILLPPEDLDIDFDLELSVFYMASTSDSITFSSTQIVALLIFK